MQTEERVLPVGFFPRAAAYLMDRAILSLVLVWVRLPMWIAAMKNGGARAVLFDITMAEIVCWAVRTAYFALMTYFSGATLGKRAMGLRVITTEGVKPDFITVLYREAIGRYLSGIVCIGYLLALGDREARTLHDRICDTRVVRDMPVIIRPPVPRELSYYPVQDPQRDWYKPYRV